jgi:hypothetical protein
VGFDERLPYPGTGEAEWRGLLDRRQTPHVINPEQGWLANWNNVPSEGWTAGDAPASERNSGRFHRNSWLRWLVNDLMRDPTWERAEGAIVRSGTVAQQRPVTARRLRLARFGSSKRRIRRRGGRGPIRYRGPRWAAARAGSNEARVLDALLAWDGSYHRTNQGGTVEPGVAIWEVFKDEAEKVAVRKLGTTPEAAEHLLGKTGLSHEFDITNGEAYALRTLTPDDYKVAAAQTFAEMEKRFGSADVASWREPRRMYKVTAQGAAKPPKLPFFDRGTWEQLVEVAPSSR